MTTEIHDALVHTAATEAAATAAAWAAAPLRSRAQLLSALADALEHDAPPLVALAHDETHLPVERLRGEVARTAYQLRSFADLSAVAALIGPLDQSAIAGPPPTGRPALTRMSVPLGPVAVFAASNFPFAFSVLGGDTASALIAGCPVVLRSHPGHPSLSRAVHALAVRCLDGLGLPPGLLGLVEAPDHAVGAALVRHPAIAAVAFTGSLRGGTALRDLAAARAVPIPFFGELGAANPVVVLAPALAGDVAGLATALAMSVTQGSGQFCTKPGLVLLPRGPAGDAFGTALQDAIAKATLHPMLTASMRANYEAGVQSWQRAEGVDWLHGPASDGSLQPGVAVVDADAFEAQPALHAEVFGPACLVVRTAQASDAARLLDTIGGTLTTTIWGAGDNADPATQAVVDAALRNAGRVLFSGVPTGVAVTAAQQHGGPWPASTAPHTTSVGLASMLRFVRPVALQDAPPWLLGRVASSLR